MSYYAPIMIARIARSPLLALALAAGVILALALGCDVDGLCMPPECDLVHGCANGRACFHGVCLYPCNADGRCGAPARCTLDDGYRFCVDADGLPVEPCPSSPDPEIT